MTKKQTSSKQALALEALPVLVTYKEKDYVLLGGFTPEHKQRTCMYAPAEHARVEDVHSCFLNEPGGCTYYAEGSPCGSAWSVVITPEIYTVNVEYLPEYPVSQVFKNVKRDSQTMEFNDFESKYIFDVNGVILRTHMRHPFWQDKILEKLSEEIQGLTTEMHAAASKLHKLNTMLVFFTTGVV